MSKKHYIEYKATCGGCSTVLEQRAKTFPSCGVQFRKQGENLRKLTAYIKTNHKRLMGELNNYGNYNVLDELSHVELDAIKMLINTSYTVMSQSINELIKSFVSHREQSLKKLMGFGDEDGINNESE